MEQKNKYIADIEYQGQYIAAAIFLAPNLKTARLNAMCWKHRVYGKKGRLIIRRLWR